MSYCTALDLRDYLHSAYLAKIEALYAGSTARHIAQVSSEIDDALRSRYVVPLSDVPATITRICAVMVSWRLAGEITSLMDTEASTQNEWLPLQTLNRQSVSELRDIAKGKLDIGLEHLGNESVSEGLLVSAPDVIFTASKWSTY